MWLRVNINIQIENTQVRVNERDGCSSLNHKSLESEAAAGGYRGVEQDYKGVS